MGFRATKRFFGSQDCSRGLIVAGQAGRGSGNVALSRVWLRRLPYRRIGAELMIRSSAHDDPKAPATDAKHLVGPMSSVEVAMEVASARIAHLQHGVTQRRCL